MSRPLDWLRQVPQIPLTASGLTIASVSQRYVYFLPVRTLADSQSSPWLDSLVIPAYCAILSGALLLFPAVGNALRKRKSPECFLESSAQAPPPPSFLRRRIESVGSVTIFLYRFLQLLSILALLVLSVLVPLRDGTPHARVAGPFTVVDIVQTVLYVRAVLIGDDVRLLTRFVEQAYLATLASFATFGSAKVVFRAFVHVSLILSVVWGVYMYRDVWPSATVDLSMADANEGILLWVKVGLLSFSGVFIPLFCPRNYVPVYPEVRACLTK